MEEGRRDPKVLVIRQIIRLKRSRRIPNFPLAWYPVSFVSRNIKSPRCQTFLMRWEQVPASSGRDGKEKKKQSIHPYMAAAGLK